MTEDWRIVEIVQLAPWVRARLWRADDWPAELETMWAEVSADHGADAPRKLWELGCAFVHCVPDRNRGLAVLIDASRAGHPEARERAIAIAENLRAHVTVAELCLANNDHARAARAYIDAGRRELAIEPLSKLVDAEASALLALAKGGNLDPEQEIANALATAKQTKGAQHYLHAARIARAALPEKATTIAITAVRTCPGDPAIEALLVEDLLERQAISELLDHYRASFVAAKNRREYVERMRSAAVELLARDLQRGLALRLLRLALETSYDELLPEVASHLAMWELLIAHAREQKSMLELVPLILKAFRAPLSQDDALYLARLGLEIAWRESRDALAAQPYAATVLDFVPDHPFAIAFVREANLDPPEMPVVRISTPIPKISMTPSGRIPIIKATPPPVPYADDKPVPRSPSTSAKVIARTTNRLALLNPPPPRTTTLRRDVSPIPATPRARSETTPRAPRVVVPIDVTIELSNGSFFTTVLRDMSTSGAFVVTKRKLEIGATLGLELRLPTKDALDQQVTHQTTAKIARQTDIGYGIQFVDPTEVLVEAIVAIT